MKKKSNVGRTKLLSKIEMEIIDIFKERRISRDDMLGFTSVLDIKKAHNEMLQWLKDNPNARYDEILNKITEIYEQD